MPAEMRTPRTRHQVTAFFNSSSGSPAVLKSLSPIRTASAPASTAAFSASAVETQTISSIGPPPFLVIR